MATIRQRGNSYQIRVSAGYDATGKQIMKMLTWTPAEGMTAKQIEKELNRATVEFEQKVAGGQLLDGNIRFSEFAEKWLEDYAKPNLAPATVSAYTILLKRTNAALGNVKLDKLQPRHLIEFYKNLAEDGVREDLKYKSAIDLEALLKKRKITRVQLTTMASLSINTVDNAVHGKSVSFKSASALCEALKIKLNKSFIAVGKKQLSGNTLSHYHRLIGSILSTAVTWQIILSNPVERVKPPKVEQKEAMCLDEKQTAHMVELLDKEPIQYKTAVILLLYSGMRRGELCGLTWADFDFDNHLVAISKASQYLPGKGIFLKETKTKGSTRTIKLPGVTFTLLKEYRKWQNEQRLALGDRWNDNDRLFTQWNGEPISPDTLTGWFGGFVKRSNLLPIHLHSLRHINASILIAAGEDVRTVSGRLGHSQTSTTLNIYSHVIQSADARAAETLENILDPLKRKG